MTWALLPLKDLVRAKTRLSGLLAAHERRALAQAMVEDVLAALCGSRGLDGVLLVSEDPCAGLLAHRYGAGLLEESELGCRGLNAVIAAACDRLAHRGVESVMVVHSDLPLLSAADIDELLSAFRRRDVDVLLSPDRGCDGTNIMIFDCKSPPGFHYGAGSCRAHLEAARSLGLRVALEARENVALDIDEPSDLTELCRRLEGSGRSGHTARYLERASIRRRIALVAGSNPDTGRSTGS